MEQGNVMVKEQVRKKVVEDKKKIRDVFKDFTTDSFELYNSLITSINIFKKSGRLETTLEAENQIKIKDLEKFEIYLENRFQLKSVLVKLKYAQKFEFDLINEWNDIISYISRKHPLTKALLKGSTIDVENNIVNVNLVFKGKALLDGKNFNVVLSELIKNLYGENYKIQFIENISEEKLKEYHEHLESLEQQVVSQAKAEMAEAVEHKKEAKEKKDESANKGTNAEQVGAQVEGENKENSEESDTPNPVIYGRAGKMSEPLVKVADLTIDSGKVMLDGEILATETRELKSGKILAMFNLFDGSSTITCKVFLEAEKSKAILKRMSSAKGVKVIGTAQFDPFAKELGVIANAIVESNGIKKVVRQDNAPVKRVELHMHTQMSQMDAMTSAEDLLKRAVKWGMKSIAITDHGVVQAFPEAHKYLEKAHPDLKVIYGVEAYLAPDTVSCISFLK